MRKRVRNLGVAIGVGFALATPVRAAPLVIDDFEAGPYSVTATTPSAQYGEVGSLPTQNVIGGVRRVQTRLVSGSFASSSLVSTASADAAELQVGASSQADFRFYYDGTADGAWSAQSGSLNTDLTLSGSAFEIDVRDVVGNISVGIYVYDSNGGEGVAATASPGRILIPFGLWSANTDFTDVHGLLVTTSYLSSGDSLSLESIQVVPEPATGALLAGGLCGLSRFSRGRRRLRRAAG